MAELVSDRLGYARIGQKLTNLAKLSDFVNSETIFTSVDIRNYNIIWLYCPGFSFLEDGL